MSVKPYLNVKVHRQRTRGEDDITDTIRSIEWSDSVSPPWGSVTIRVKVDLAVSKPLPGEGDWIVIRKSEQSRALGFYRVHSLSSSIKVGPRKDRMLTEFTIQAESWLDFLGRVMVYAGPGISSGSGTLMSMDGWRDIFNAIKEAVTNDVGLGLTALVREIARVEMPPTLGRGELGGEIGVVHNDATSQAFTRGIRVAEPVPGPSLTSMGSTANLLSGVTALSMIQSAFGADSGMVEMFPSVEPLLEGPPEKRAELRGQSSELSFLGESLNAMPVLIYRMRPWRETALVDYVSQIAPEYSVYVRGDVFFTKTWNADKARKVPRSEVISVDFAYDDQMGVNAATCAPPGMGDSLLRFFESAGLPVRAQGATLDSGLRLYQVQWPFFPPIDALDVQGGPPADLAPGFEGPPKLTEFTWLQYLATLSMQAYQWHLNGNRFARGTARMALNFDVRHGEPLRIEVPEGFGANIPGAVVSEANPYPNQLVCYAERVTHSVEIGDGRQDVVARTRVQYARGLFNEALRTIGPIPRLV